MSRYRKAIYLCLASGPIMSGSELIGGTTFSTSLVLGFVAVALTLAGLHLGLWAKSAV